MSLEQPSDTTLERTVTHLASRDAGESHRSLSVSDLAVRSVRGGAVGLGPSDATAEPPWPELPAGQELRWERFMRFAGPFEAHIVAGRLNLEGVPTVLLSALGPDLSDKAEILVPCHLMHRARWVMAWPSVPDEELQFLATGEIGPVAET
jgi:hypothetical protein